MRSVPGITGRSVKMGESMSCPAAPRHGPVWAKTLKGARPPGGTAGRTLGSPTRRLMVASATLMLPAPPCHHDRRMHI